MSTDEKLKQFVKRFVNECKKKGIDNPADLSEATIKAGYPISYTSAYKNWIGQNYPGLPSLIAYAETLGINIHYLVTGEQPPPAGDPKKLFKEFIEEHFQHGRSSSRYDWFPFADFRSSNENPDETFPNKSRKRRSQIVLSVSALCHLQGGTSD